MEQNTTTKVYARCKKELPLTAFYRNANGKYGVTSTCKECHRAQMHENYLERRKRKSATTQNWQNPKFADKTPRELQQKMRELKQELIARGFSCEIKCTYLNTIII